MCPGPGASAVVRIFLNWMAGCLRPPPASSGEEAENRGASLTVGVYAFDGAGLF